MAANNRGQTPVFCGILQAAAVGPRAMVALIAAIPADVAAAATAALTSVGAAYKAAANGVVIFNYGTDTYALIENGLGTQASFDAANDYLVKITGVTGTVSAADFLIS